jgi:methionyl-tRNA formyltransferase
LSIIFFGTPEFAIPSLKALLGSGEEIALVVTQTDKVKGRGHRLSPPPIKSIALEAGLRVLQPAASIDERVAHEIALIRPEFIIVVAYGKLLPKGILEIPRYGCVNVHASLLPKYRGASPIQWAILRGEAKTGVTTMLMDEGLDTGPLLLRQETEIHAEDTGESLGERLAGIGASLLVKTIKGLREGTITPVPQTGISSYAPPLRKTDGLVDWSRSAGELFNFVRGMLPWPGAYCHIGNVKTIIFRTEVLEGKGIPGVVEKIVRKGPIVGTGDGLLLITDLQPSGKKRMPAEAFMLGRSLRKGERIQ